MKITVEGLVSEMYQSSEHHATMLEGVLRHYFDKQPGGIDRVEAILDMLEMPEQQAVQIQPLIRTHNRYFDRVSQVGCFTDALAIRK